MIWLYHLVGIMSMARGMLRESLRGNGAVEEGAPSRTAATKQAGRASSQRATNPGRVLQVLQGRITSGVYKPGEWLPTERELAHELAVNRSAVRDALLRLQHNGSIDRQPGCRPRVATGDPPVIGRQRAANASSAIAVVMPQHQLDYASREIVRGISSVFRSVGTHYRQSLFDVLLPDQEPFQIEQEACDALKAGDAAGAIVWPTLNAQVLQSWREVRDMGCPVVFVDRFDRSMSCDFVGVDNYTAAREAVEYLLELGHTRIAHLTNSEPVSAVRERDAGYMDAMDSAGLSYHRAVWTLTQNHETEAGAVIDAGMEADGVPTAIFAINDNSAYRCIKHLTRKGMRVPDDISVIGFDDIDRFSPRTGFLTSVRQPFERIGQQAADLLLKRLGSTFSGKGGQEEPYLQILTPTRLIERQSCRAIESK